MAGTYAGGCRCSAVRYEISAEPLMMLQCQCRECQQATGGGHGSWLAFPLAAAKIFGKPARFNRPTDSGAAFVQEFCQHCGSPLFGRSATARDHLYVMAGSLDDPSVFKPQMVMYTGRGHRWDKIDPALKSFPEMPQRT
jgi:hypothetical protein